MLASFFIELAQFEFFATLTIASFDPEDVASFCAFHLDCAGFFGFSHGRTLQKVF